MLFLLLGLLDKIESSLFEIKLLLYISPFSLVLLGVGFGSLFENFSFSNLLVLVLVNSLNKLATYCFSFSFSCS